MNQTTIEPTESNLAAEEFAEWIKQNRARVQKREHYEVRPCNRVRGFMLRLPGIGWRLWFPTAAEAVSFAGRVASTYKANCHVYDVSGKAIG